MFWDRVVRIMNNSDYEECKERFLTIFAMEYPFTAEEHEDISRDKREDMAFEKVLAKFKERGDRLAATAWPVIKDVYENRGHQYENILVPLTDGRRMYQISVPLKEAYETQAENVMLQFEKAILLHTIDDAWKENLRGLDELQHSVQNASYEQKDPLLIFKLESVTLFDNMVNEINDGTISVLMRTQLPQQQPQDVQQAPQQMQRRQQPQYTEHKQNLDEMSETQRAMHQAAQSPTSGGGAPQQRQPIVNQQPRVGRNDPCPCGSGKKFKNCHGRGLV
jgi:preprotein translocase subunit SecA